MSEAVSELKNV